MFVLLGSTALPYETRKNSICCDACGWIEREEVFKLCVMVYCAQKRYIFVRPHWIQHLNAFRVEAAWKLGQWGDLEQCLKAVCKTGLFCEICMLNIELF